LSNSDVFFADLRADCEAQNLPNKVKRLFEQLKPQSFIAKSDLVAIKTHFGELGTNTFIPPYFVRKVVDVIINHGGKPFLLTI